MLELDEFHLGQHNHHDRTEKGDEEDEKCADRSEVFQHKILVSIVSIVRDKSLALTIVSHGGVLRPVLS